MEERMGVDRRVDVSNNNDQRRERVALAMLSASRFLSLFLFFWSSPHCFADGARRLSSLLFQTDYQSGA